MQHTPPPSGLFMGSRGVAWILKAKCTEIITFQANPIKTSSRLVGPRCGKYQCRNSGKHPSWILTFVLAALGGSSAPCQSVFRLCAQNQSLHSQRKWPRCLCCDSLMNDHFICSVNSCSSHFYSSCTIDAM